MFCKGGISLAINKSRQECFPFLNPCRKDFVVALLNSNCRFLTVDGVAIDLLLLGGKSWGMWGDGQYKRISDASSYFVVTFQ